MAVGVLISSLYRLNTHRVKKVGPPKIMLYVYISSWNILGEFGL